MRWRCLPSAQVRHHLGQQVRILQCAMQAAGAGNTQALQYIVELVGHARPTAAGQLQAAGHAAVLGQPIGDAGQAQLVVEEADVEGGVVRDHLAATQEFQQLGGLAGKQRLAHQHRIADAVHALRAPVHRTLWLQVGVELATGELAIDQFHRPDFDDPVAHAMGDAGGFGIQCDDAAHACGGFLVRAVMIFACP